VHDTVPALWYFLLRLFTLRLRVLALCRSTAAVAGFIRDGRRLAYAQRRVHAKFVVERRRTDVMRAAVAAAGVVASS